MARILGLGLLLLLLALAAAGAWVGWHWEAVVARLAQEPVQAERDRWQGRVATLEDQVQALREALEARPQPLSQAPPEAWVQVFGEQSPMVMDIPPKDLSCAQLDTALSAFFADLDDSDDHLPEAGSRKVLTASLGELADNPPEIAGETFHPRVVFRNRAFFFRLLGSDRIRQLQRILHEQHDLAEPVMGVLYHRLQRGQACPGEPLPMTAAELYPYGVFFLRTLGGHSYIFRRSPPVPWLARYYAVQSVYAADRAQRNSLGLDVRPFLLPLVHELKARQDLRFKQAYLHQLTEIVDYYTERRGPPS